MFNIFKKQEKTVAVPFVKTNVKNYPKEVLEIHHEFETAAEKLLEEANNIINSQPVVNEFKIQALKALGFKQVKEVQESTEILAKTQMSKEQIELVQYYQQNYPFNKFINEEQVKTICFKYNLVCGDVDRFKGFVPEKNLNEIVNFKLKDEDISVSGVLWGDIITNNRINHSITLKEYNDLLSLKKIFGDGKGDLTQDDNWCHGEDINQPYSYFDRITKDKLQICAPIKDMDISGLKLKEGYKLEKEFIPDPVVLQPVKGGYLILTAWGDEASDPLVVNQNFN